MDFGRMFADLSDRAGGAALVAGDDTELSSRMVMVIRINHVVEQLLFRLTGEIEARGIARRTGRVSTAKQLQEAGMAPAVAHRYVRVGKALGDIEAVTAYGIDGTLSGEHVDAIVKGLHHIDRRNTDLSEEQRSECVRDLLRESFSGTPTEISARARHMAIVLAPPDKEVPDAENHDLNELSYNTGADGRTQGTFDLDNLLGEKLAAALGSLATTALEPDGSPDRRNNAQIRADALERLLDIFLSLEDRPTCGGTKPHVAMTVSPEFLQQLQQQGISRHGGAATTQMAAEFEWTGPVSMSSAQMVACDSVLTTVLMDGNSVPLDVGRDHRTVTPAIRKALIARDRGCAFPGCGCPAAYTDAHHIVFWSNGGTTSLSNTVLLCRRHHRYIHHHGWQVVMRSDGHPWFIEPGGTEPMRSHARRTMTSELIAA